jgi:cysteine desulfurase family protein (TIGR01976 family)
MAGQRGDRRLSTAATFDVAAVRARFTALQRQLAFFDGPGGTQCPDEVIDAIALYLRGSNANVGAPYETSRRTDALVEHAHQRAADFLGCTSGEVAFGPSMTSLNFLLTRAFGRTLRAGDEVLVTKLDHDANVAPWLELQHDLGIEVRFVDVTDELALDYDDLEQALSERTRVVAFPVAANSVGTAPDVRRIVDLAHSAGALAWADAVHYAPHGPIDVASWDVDVLICSPYKFFGPHLGLAFGKGELLADWRPYKVRPSPNEPVGRRFELGTLQHELLAGFVAAVDYIDSLGWEAITRHERDLGERFLAGLPDGVRLHGLPTMAGRVPTFCFDVPGLGPKETAERLAQRDLAVWWGNYYALETMKRLGLDPDEGAVRAGIVHYNTAAEVDRLLDALGDLVP